MDRIIATVNDTLARPCPFDFCDRAFVPTVRDDAPTLLADRSTWHVPEVETLFVQRKVSGTALLGVRRAARGEGRRRRARGAGGATPVPT